ncbi:DUF185-domain-containing protein, partial [Aaosphaeria arxii CBS 175.79]
MRAIALTVCRNAVRSSRTQALTLRSTQCGVRWSSSTPTKSAPTSLSSIDEREWSTPLAKTLAQAITTTGPISVAAYMRQCLTHPDGGYYTRQTTGHDQFGTKGDFITSPEISQVFGELVGVWLYTEWLAQGQKEKVQIIEVGPGRGTLMDDVLRTLSNFKRFSRSVEAIYLIEASPHLRKQQAQLLAGTDELKDTDIGWTAPCKYIPGCNIIWCEDIRLVPKEESTTPFILAHEFFDALPIHIFQSVKSTSIPASSTIMTPTGPIKPKTGPQAPQSNWHELVVSPTSPYTSNPSPPPSSPENATATAYAKPDPKAPKDDFELTLSKTPTPHSLYLPQKSPRYKALQSTEGAIVEISPESLSYISDFATRIGGANPAPRSPPPSTSTTPQRRASEKEQPFHKPNPSGAALILDYGPLDTIPANTLRGIRSHAACSPFRDPGLVDLSADVDFLALAEAALDASPGVEVHGPVEQAFFLSTLGIKERVERLVKGKKKDGSGESEEGKEVAERVEGAWKRLVDRGPTGMGRIYKALAILPYVEGRAVRRPVGFGGDVVG